MKKLDSWATGAVPIASSCFQGGASAQQQFWSTLHILVLRAKIDLQLWLRGRQLVQSQISVCIPNLPAQILALLMLFTKPYGPNACPQPLQEPSSHCPCMYVTSCHCLCEFNRSWQPVWRPACSLLHSRSLESSTLPTPDTNPTLS